MSKQLEHCGLRIERFGEDTISAHVVGLMVSYILESRHLSQEDSRPYFYHAIHRHKFVNNGLEPSIIVQEIVNSARLAREYADQKGEELPMPPVIERLPEYVRLLVESCFE